MRKLASALMVQGTASSVGKSLLTAALCRIFRQDGVRVAPFKAQNIALNSFVTPDGGEIGRAQAVQAGAAGLEPRVEMNPILLKPEPEARCQLVVMGKARRSVTWPEYHALRGEMSAVVESALDALRNEYELIVIEGAGNPAEINLGEDLVNMHVARVADARVLLVGDIDRGGVFAQLVGTMELLTPPDRARVAGFLINKFRGQESILRPGLDFMEDRYGVPVLGVVPWIDRLRIADEDSVALDDPDRRGKSRGHGVDIAVVKLPNISNFDDFLPLEHEPGVSLRYFESANEVGGADLLIIPGTKSTEWDLNWFKYRFNRTVHDRIISGRPVLGICGGCQILGGQIYDPDRVESARTVTQGIEALSITTLFASDKVTAQVKARLNAPSFLGAPDEIGEISGYEIHMGRIRRSNDPAAFTITNRNGSACEEPDGAIDGGGYVIGTMIHGLFENDRLRASMLNWFGERKGLGAGGYASVWSREAEYDRVAAVVRGRVDIEAIRRIAGIARKDFSRRNY